MELFMRPIADDLNSVTDEALATLLTTAPILHQLGGTTVVRLSESLIMKGGGSVMASEAEMLRLIASRTTIRAPRVYRSFQVKDDTQYFGTSGYIVMDFIPGQPLDECWNSLSRDTQGKIAAQGRFFTDFSAGPFMDPAEMEAWFNHKLEICKSVHQAPKVVPPFHFTKFVLTNHDISPRNMILDQHEQVWLIDWAYSGAYPPVFESAALSIQPFFTDFNEAVLSLIPRYPKEEMQLDSIAYELTTAALAYRRLRWKPTAPVATEIAVGGVGGNSVGQQ
ncbi:Aminoglycoside phosphotransferase [Penicillium canescens]|uniref:Aminoglycoside phosphotransferase n=1 Tax=Penicillium canescens TaxID=5083 RepID=A0AAD6I964_PENCN|nr:Aminoglycoside phosphotransferase [Penicillium canescens]KAJ6020184.1 Aminoglycoside phosphotransferase [Penicillium canescens]KAJ6038138.1 Aminoglycoside phosphotransferase [Penicillium canescens]KAJ6045539.1 Aminoglycoside phosphotransferase [Penicillium canescens]KAJ6061222.1 Aminoglycoside phosphotransferase [Penicillium canescens]KAJ6090764.1 Aminoglycoside phosphotransferase [Penicillium canescens]